MPQPLSSTINDRIPHRRHFLARQRSFTFSEMALNGTRPAKHGKSIQLYTGNIMTDGGRGGFLNTTMSKNNAEVCMMLGPSC